jgi:hypothetical protein
MVVYERPTADTAYVAPGSTQNPVETHSEAALTCATADVSSAPAAPANANAATAGADPNNKTCFEAWLLLSP